MHELFYFAYIDPGTGSLIIQSLIGAVAGVALFGRRMYYSAKAKLSGRKSTEATKTDTPAPSDKAVAAKTDNTTE